MSLVHEKNVNKTVPIGILKGSLERVEVVHEDRKIKYFKLCTF